MTGYEVPKSRYQQQLEELSDSKVEEILGLADLGENATLGEEQVNQVCSEVIQPCINIIESLGNEKTFSARDYGWLEDTVEWLHSVYMYFFETKQKPVPEPIQEKQKDMFESLIAGYTLLGYDITRADDGSSVEVTNKESYHECSQSFTIGKEVIFLKINCQSLNQNSQKSSLLEANQKQQDVVSDEEVELVEVEFVGEKNTLRNQVAESFNNNRNQQ